MFSGELQRVATMAIACSCCLRGLVRLLDNAGKKIPGVVFELLAYLIPHYLGLPFRRHFS
jgi:hypothetical protein